MGRVRGVHSSKAAVCLMAVVCDPCGTSEDQLHLQQVSEAQDWPRRVSSRLLNLICCLTHPEAQLLLAAVKGPLSASAGSGLYL